jgi:Tol biopolymer transport system component
LTNNPSPDYFPDWSPDSRKIAFTSTRQGDTWSQIYVINADGTNPTRLTGFDTTDDNHNQQPSWSPDGREIAFVSQRDDGFGEIYVMNADGTGHINISNNPFGDLFPDWGPATDTD